MTLEDIKKIPKNFLTAVDVAPYLNADPNVIRYQARLAPERLGFPVVVMKSRVKIPKNQFVQVFERGVQE